MILPQKQYQRNRWEVAFVVRNITITAEVEGSKALRKTAFPPLNTFYSSSVFSHLAADESEKFSFLCTKMRTMTIIFLFFIQRRSQRPWIRREGSVPFPTRQAGELQRAPSSQRGLLLVPGWALSPHHIPCRDVTTQQLHAHPPIREVGSPHHNPCSDHGRLWQHRYLWGGPRGQGVQPEHGVTACKRTCSICPKYKKSPLVWQLCIFWPKRQLCKETDARTKMGFILFTQPHKPQETAFKWLSLCTFKCAVTV